MTYREKARKKVEELDAYKAKLDRMYEECTDEKEKKELGELILDVCAMTNKYLKMAGAEENEMYDL